MTTFPSDSPSLGPLGKLLRRLQGGSKRSRRPSRLARLRQAIEDRLGGDDDSAEPRRPPLALPAPPPIPGDLLRQLLASSEEQTRDQAEVLFFTTVLRSLTPDQARILSALSGGATYPLIHIHGGGRLGMGMRPVLECVSSVGRNAGVSCPDLTPVYVRGLMAWGLAEIEAVELDDRLKYELLETETSVRRILGQLKQSGQGSRILRHSLRLSPLGERLWLCCRLDEEES